MAGYYFGGPIVGSLTSMGVSMMIGGVVQMLSPQPQSNTGDATDNGASHNFTGAVNTTAQGNPVPLLYGRMIVGSAVISAGILAQAQAYVGVPLTGPSIPKVIGPYENIQ